MFKKNGFRRRVVSIFLSVVLSLYVVAPAFAQDQQAELDKAVSSLKAQQTEMNKTKNTIAEIKQTLLELDTTINDLNARMADTQAEVDRLEEERLAKEAELEERLAVMYMYGNEGFAELLFSAQNITELLTRIDQMRAVMKSDRECVDAIEQAKRDIEAGTASIREDKANVEVLKAEKEAFLTTNNTLLELQQIQYETEKAAAEQLAQSMGYYGIDSLINELAWPTDVNGPNAFCISDWFGYRVLPITEYHSGIDMTPGNGTPILAAASGVVTKAECASGYGNVVVIEHGKNSEGKTIHTLYGHQSNYIVSVGQSVSQGEVIGYVGSTGLSTGPHIHFEVWEDGVQVDPMSYYPQYQDKCVFIP